jgi:hypothetical protein
VPGSNVTLTNALHGYCFAEYENGLDAQPTFLPWVQNYIDHFVTVRRQTKTFVFGPGLAIHAEGLATLKAGLLILADGLANLTPPTSTHPLTPQRSRYNIRSR